jgi:flagellin-like hook-associated protein FlgL
LSTPKIDPIAIAKDELADAKAQRDKAQQDLNTAQAQMQQAQANANAAQAMILTASGAIQQCEGFLKKLSAQADIPQEPK